MEVIQIRTMETMKTVACIPCARSNCGDKNFMLLWSQHKHKDKFRVKITGYVVVCLNILKLSSALELCKPCGFERSSWYCYYCVWVMAKSKAVVCSNSYYDSMLVFFVVLIYSIPHPMGDHALVKINYCCTPAILLFHHYFSFVCLITSYTTGCAVIHFQKI